MLKLGSLKMQIFAVNMLASLMLLAVALCIWSYVIVPSIASGNANLKGTLLQRQKEVSDIRSAAGKSSQSLFFEQQFSTAAQFNKMLHGLLTQYKEVTLIALKEGQPKSMPISKALGSALSSWRRRTVKVIDFDIQLLGKYKPILGLLADMHHNDSGIFWDSLSYKVKTYPNTVLHLKLHIISR